jgi:hypothetical protein
MASTDWEAVAGIDDEEDPFASPSQAATTKAEIKSAQTEDAPPRMGESRFDAAEIRDAALKKELESVRGINEVLEGVIASLEKAKDNMEVRAPSPLYFLVTSHGTPISRALRFLPLFPSSNIC